MEGLISLVTQSELALIPPVLTQCSCQAGKTHAASKRAPTRKETAGKLPIATAQHRSVHDLSTAATAVAKQARAKADAKTQKLLDKQFLHAQLVAQKREITGYYNKESDDAKINNLYIERDGVQGLSNGDLYVGYSQTAVSRAGYEDWNWSTGAQIGDYFSGNGAQREDAGKFFFSDTSFL